MPPAPPSSLTGSHSILPPPPPPPSLATASSLPTGLSLATVPPVPTAPALNSITQAEWNYLEKALTRPSLEQMAGDKYPILATRTTTCPLELLRLAGNLLNLPIHTLAFAHIYWHRVNKALQTSEATGGYWALDKQLLIAACLHLACKSSEVSRKVRDIVNVFFSILNPEKMDLSIGSRYHQLRDSVVATELCVLRLLEFNLNVETPHVWLAWILSSMMGPLPPPLENDYFDPPKKSPTEIMVAKLAWLNATESLKSEQLMQSSKFQMVHVAMACVYIAFRVLQLDLPMPFVEWCEVFGIGDGKDVDNVREAVGKLTDLY